MSIDIEKLAREAGGVSYDSVNPRWDIYSSDLNRFAALVLEQAALKCRSRIMGDLNREDAEAVRCAEAIEAMMPKDAE